MVHHPTRTLIMARVKRLLVAVGVWCFFAWPSAAQLIINEIMYHPASHDPREEFIELHNIGSSTVNLTSWTLSGGVDFAFPTNTSIPAGGYLVIAGDRQTFTNRYPGVANVVGSFVVMRVSSLPGHNLTNWLNTLGNTRNDIHLNNQLGERVDSVEYADEGDWAIRRHGLLDLNHRGWTWWAEHDGLGKSLELVNPAMPNEYGQNWAASFVDGGTPGAANSVRSSNIEPLIIEPRHFPVVPQPAQTVYVTARLLDEQPSGVTARLFYRDASTTTPPPFTNVVMLDDGVHGDGIASDGIFGASIPPFPNNTVIEFYISATDAQANTRTWPAPALPAEDEVGDPAQLANALYQVDN